jgi:prolyl 4-hydroxylase
MSYLSPTMRALLSERGSFFWTVHDVYSLSECEALVARIEAAGPALAPITTARGPVIRTDIRTNERVMFDDPDLAQDLFRRVAPHVPPELAGRPLHGTNPRFRGYRYNPGQAFKPHYDGSYRKSDTMESELTLLVYLNESFDGGETRFLDIQTDVRPRTGSVLLFAHRVLHEGAEVVSGTKYVLRSDVMYGTEA